MLNRVKRFVLLLALAVLPVQGVGGSFANLACHAGMGEHGAHGAQVHDGHDHGVQENGHSDEGKAVDMEHSSCHPLTPVLPVVMFPWNPSDYPVWAAYSHGLPDFFIPDRPQRPPLA